MSRVPLIWRVRRSESYHGNNPRFTFDIVAIHRVDLLKFISRAWLYRFQSIPYLRDGTKSRLRNITAEVISILACKLVMLVAETSFTSKGYLWKLVGAEKLVIVVLTSTITSRPALENNEHNWLNKISSQRSEK